MVEACVGQFKTKRVFPVDTPSERIDWSIGTFNCQTILRVFFVTWFVIRSRCLLTRRIFPTTKSIGGSHPIGCGATSLDTLSTV